MVRWILFGVSCLSLLLALIAPSVNGQQLQQNNIRCYSCLKTTNCFEGECTGSGCFKITGKRNEETVTYKGCLFQIPGVQYRDECKQGEQGGIQGNMCTCLSERCNSANSMMVASRNSLAFLFLWTVAVSGFLAWQALPYA